MPSSNLRPAGPEDEDADVDRAAACPYLDLRLMIVTVYAKRNWTLFFHLYVRPQCGVPKCPDYAIQGFVSQENYGLGILLQRAKHFFQRNSAQVFACSDFEIKTSLESSMDLSQPPLLHRPNKESRNDGLI